ncbi:MAG TPA: SO_0444 family Cu/Zn efflux transporter [Candidatus Brocadiia bacterium]|nr:SO_0444 family Cu/Zn efflux transporter [Candidatus Brocadiia bacterium]
MHDMREMHGSQSAAGIGANLLAEFWSVLGDMAPYLLFGFAIAGLLHVLISEEKVRRHLGGRGLLPVLKATLLGVPLPLCSCGVIPVAASLRKSGASKGATTAFLLSTPQTGVDSILVTYSLLGPAFAVIRPFAALVTGISGGAVETILDPDEEAVSSGADGTGVKSGSGCDGSCCGGEHGGSKPRRAARYAFVTLPADIGKPLLVGLALAGLIAVAVPDNYFGEKVGTGLPAMLLMMLVGIPMYVCATASVPIAAALILKGVSPGAALVFLMTGPGTNAATISTIWKTMGRRAAFVYLGATALCALASGFLLDAFVVVDGGRMVGASGWMMPEWIKSSCAVILAAVIVHSILLRRRKGGLSVAKSPAISGGEETVLKVSGMTCSHCADSVRKALMSGSGVQSVEVDLTSGRADVHGMRLDRKALIHSLEELGFAAKEAAT